MLAIIFAVWSARTDEGLELEERVGSLCLLDKPLVFDVACALKSHTNRGDDAQHDCCDVDGPKRQRLSVLVELSLQPYQSRDCCVG